MSILTSLAALLLAVTPLAAVEQVPALRDLKAVWRADFNSDASRVVVQLRDGGLGIWETADGTPVPGDLGNLTTQGTYVIDAAARRALVGMEKGGSRVFDLTTGTALSPVMDASFDDTGEPPAGFSPDGALVHVLGKSGTWSILEVATGRRVASLDLPPGTDDREVTPKFEFSKDGGTAFVLDGLGTLHRYDTHTWKEGGTPLSHPDREAYHIGFAVSPDNRHAVTFDSPGENGPMSTLQLWDLTTSRTVGEPLRERNGLSGSFLDPHRLLITPGRGETRVVKVPSLETELTLPRHDDVESSRAVISADGSYSLTWGYDSKVLKTDTRTGKYAGGFSTRAQVKEVFTAPGSIWITLDNTVFLAERYYDFYITRLDPSEMRPAATLRLMGSFDHTILSPDASRLMILEGGTDKERIRIFDSKTLVEQPCTAAPRSH